MARTVADGVQVLDDLAFGREALVLRIHVHARADGAHAHVAMDAVEGRGVHGNQVVRRLAEVLVLAGGCQLVVALHAGDERGLIGDLQLVG